MTVKCSRCFLRFPSSSRSTYGRFQFGIPGNLLYINVTKIISCHTVRDRYSIIEYHGLLRPTQPPNLYLLNLCQFPWYTVVQYTHHYLTFGCWTVVAFWSHDEIYRVCRNASLFTVTSCIFNKNDDDHSGLSLRSSCPVVLLHHWWKHCKYLYGKVVFPFPAAVCTQCRQSFSRS